jgi:DNA repair protein SbcD/Mre11
MRLLHTSDWHLGRSFHREDLLAAQAQYVDFVVETVTAEKVDAVLISGDIYDRAIPAVDAVSLFDEALSRIRGAGAHIVGISGNHDSARRVGFAGGLMAVAGVHLRTRPAEAGRPVLLTDEHGPVAVYTVPYLEPDLVSADLGTDERTHAAVLTAAMTAARADLTKQAKGTRSVVLAHAFVTGGEASDSERDISVGGVASVPVETFTGVDYVALGHLHGRQSLRPSVRYSGSPLAYSFSETGQTKGCWLVELDADGLGAVEPVDAPVPRRLARISGRLDDILTSRALAEVEDCWLQVTLTDPSRPVDPMERLRQRFPHTLVLEFAPDGAMESAESSYAGRIAGRSDLDIALGFVDHVRQRPPSDDEQALLATAFAAVRAAEVNV